VIHAATSAEDLRQLGVRTMPPEMVKKAKRRATLVTLGISFLLALGAVGLLEAIFGPLIPASASWYLAVVFIYAMILLRPRWKTVSFIAYRGKVPPEVNELANWLNDQLGAGTARVKYTWVDPFLLAGKHYVAWWDFSGVHFLGNQPAPTSHING
jgi:hypothetical protein